MSRLISLGAVMSAFLLGLNVGHKARRYSFYPFHLAKTPR